ncbi:hypothetical protein HZR81_19150 [Pseudomonas sp. LM13]
MALERFHLLGRRTSAASLVLRGCFQGKEVVEVAPWSGEQTDHWQTTVQLRSEGITAIVEFNLFFPDGGEDPNRVDLIRLPNKEASR